MPALDARAHAEPHTWCQHPHCPDTNWGGYSRLHIRDSTYPPYAASPAPNEMADFWEGIRVATRKEN